MLPLSHPNPKHQTLCSVKPPKVIFFFHVSRVSRVKLWKVRMPVFVSPKIINNKISLSSITWAPPSHLQTRKPRVMNPNEYTAAANGFDLGVDCCQVGKVVSAPWKRQCTWPWPTCVILMPLLNFSFYLTKLEVNIDELRPAKKVHISAQRKKKKEKRQLELACAKHYRRISQLLLHPLVVASVCVTDAAPIQLCPRRSTRESITGHLVYSYVLYRGYKRLHWYDGDARGHSRGETAERPSRQA